MLLLEIAVNRGYVSIGKNRTKESSSRGNPLALVLIHEETDPYGEEEICGSVRSEFPPDDNVRFDVAKTLVWFTLIIRYKCLLLRLPVLNVLTEGQELRSFIIVPATNRERDWRHII